MSCCTLIYFSSLLQIGIIGGSGMDDPDILENRREKCVSTPYGEVCTLFYLTCFLCLVPLPLLNPPFKGNLHCCTKLMLNHWKYSL